MTNFTVDNIYKWNDVLASHLLPMPSNTYLQSFSFLRYRVRHPLIPAFDANERIKTNYAHVDFPKGAFCEEPITSVTGYITIRVNIPRPKTVFDRVLSFPVIKREETHNANGGGIWGTLVDIAVGKNNVTKTWEEKQKIANEHIIIYDNFQEAQPADVIEVVKFDNFFENGSKDENRWKAIANLCGYEIVEDFLANYFSHKTISKWNSTFNDEIAPKVLESLLDNTITISPFSSIDLTLTAKYHGGSDLMRLNLRTNISHARNHKDLEKIQINYAKTVSSPSDFWAFVTFNVENVNINYTTKHYEGCIINKYIGDDLFDNDGTKNPPIPTPMNSDEQRDPRKEDIYIVTKLIEHLNSNLEYYNKILWYRLDPDRRYMLLDGFGIQVFDETGKPIPGVPGTRSLASVVKNVLITVTGNSLVFPVAAGYRVNQSYIFEDKRDGVASNTESPTLLDHYQPLTPVPPYRISVPSKGVFAEAVQGACDACEKVKEQSSQDWTKFTTEEPTPIAPIVAPTPTITDWKAAWKDFAPPLINIQNAPATPAPGAGLNGITELLGKSGVFKDITGLDATQQNVIRTYLSNQENAKAFAEMAKSMAMQEHNTQHSDSIMATANSAKDSGAITKDEYGKLVKDHIQRQIDGGENQNQQAAQQRKTQETSPIKSAVELAQTGNREVSATESDSDGNTKTLDVKSIGDSSSKGDTNNNVDNANLKYNFTVPGTIEAIKQQSANACWATVTTMMSNWKKQQTQSVDDYINSIGAEYVPFIQTGITIAKLTDFCNAAGLETAYSNTNFPPSVYYKKLQKNGPIWVIDLESANPKQLHGRLLIGIKGDDSSATTMFTIIDPAKDIKDSKYDEDLPTFVSKTENVVKTLDAVKDVQIPLLIYYKDGYEKSKFSDTSKNDATIGAGRGSGSTNVSIISDKFITSVVNDTRNQFKNSSEINDFFNRVTGFDFIVFFNKFIGNKSSWSGINITTEELSLIRFMNIWDNVPQALSIPSVNLIQFLCLQSAILNETGGIMNIPTERIGIKDFPGLKYTYSTIPKNYFSGYSGKTSYNAAPLNKLAFDLFNNIDFITAHGSLSGADLYKNTTDRRWAGAVYPATETDPNKLKFVAQADFHKYRGRGYIQITWRKGYLPIIEYILKYNGDNSIINKYRDSWLLNGPYGPLTKNQFEDLKHKIATITTNEDWDELFQNTDSIIALKVLDLHSSGNALKNIKIDTGANCKNSISTYGKSLNGGDYHIKLSNRVVQILNEIGNT